MLKRPNGPYAHYPVLELPPLDFPHGGVALCTSGAFSVRFLHREDGEIVLKSSITVSRVLISTSSSLESFVYVSRTHLVPLTSIQLGNLT